MPPSRLDAFYRRLLITRFFEKGWGKPENLRRLFEFRKIVSNRKLCYNLVPVDYPVEITREDCLSDCKIIEGKFITPLELHLPGLVPKMVQQAHFQILLPKKWADKKHKPTCIHLAGTGDHFYWRRRNFIAKPLLKEAGIGAILLENPFYGVRKPQEQVRSNLQNVSDIFVMGGCLILECLVLLHWCERNGLGPLGITGLSMGGHMASLAATNWPKPLVLVPCLSWSTASTVFTQGVMSQSINWDMLETQYFSDGQYSENLSKMVTVIDNAFMAGQQFIKHFNQSMKALQSDIKEVKNDENIYSNHFSDPHCILPLTKIESHQLNEKRSLMKIDKHNSLSLSSELYKESTLDEQVQLFNDELNGKLQKIQEKIRTKQKQKTDLNNSNNMSTDITLNTQESNKKSLSLPFLSNSEETTLTKLMNYIYPKSTAVLSRKSVSVKKSENINTTKAKWWEREALQFMRGMMDECTHLKNFSVPYDTSLIIAVCAKDDAYVPREGCSSLEDIWPGAEVRYVDAGHVSAYVLYQKSFRSSIIEAFERAKKKKELNNGEFESELPNPTITFDELFNRYQTWCTVQEQSQKKLM